MRSLSFFRKNFGRGYWTRDLFYMKDNGNIYKEGRIFDRKYNLRRYLKYYRVGQSSKMEPWMNPNLLLNMKFKVYEYSSTPYRLNFYFDNYGQMR